VKTLYLDFLAFNEKLLNQRHQRLLKVEGSIIHDFAHIAEQTAKRVPFNEVF